MKDFVRAQGCKETLHAVKQGTGRSWSGFKGGWWRGRVYARGDVFLAVAGLVKEEELETQLCVVTDDGKLAHACAVPLSPHFDSNFDDLADTEVEDEEDADVDDDD